MRLLRELAEERTARMLADALADAGIDAELKESHEGRHTVWVIDENQLEQARNLDADWFASGPTPSEALTRAANRGRAAREIHERAEQRRRLQAEAAAREVEALSRPRPTPLTWGLIGLCIAVAVLTELGNKREMVAALTIADPNAPVHVTVLRVFGRSFEWLGLPWREPWRLVTPVLVHFDGLHILLNMLWLRDLGRVIETVHGARYLGIFVVVCGALSNIAQYELGQSAYFAGMSGVVYGMLGLLWMRGRLDPRVGYGISRVTVQFMLIWLAVGFLGDFGIANWCHLFGLLIGMAWGSTAAGLAGSRRSPS
jgi:GlpG protein